MANYEDKLLDHDADGIQEYDNPMPGWLMGILWGAIIFAILYLGYYALSYGEGGYTAEYRGDRVAYRADVQKYFDDNPLEPPAAEELLAGAANPEVVAKGRERFTKTCASCHGEQAQGLIGPNLTDDRWIHGGKVLDMFNVLVKGVPAKGMPPWGRALPPEDLSALVSYIRSAQGSNPPNPKPPEGDPAAPEPLPGS
ncbi:MAG: c-type cytochrome [Deltaproteobacteria bacterium]|jgi:cytochrome c oxidase cbb3-type subunit 3|nr:c-type cytochrome [Deltaproteobacteria bacterium]MBW2536320.1 c-type cytochrome [Deltaproteobacteria bacterium]